MSGSQSSNDQKNIRIDRNSIIPVTDNKKIPVIKFVIITAALTSFINRMRYLERTRACLFLLKNHEKSTG
jgi:hypothetical protein